MGLGVIVLVVGELAISAGVIVIFGLFALFVTVIVMIILLVFTPSLMMLFFVFSCSVVFVHVKTRASLPKDTSFLPPHNSHSPNALIRSH